MFWAIFSSTHLVTLPKTFRPIFFVFANTASLARSDPSGVDGFCFVYLSQRQ
jgi:hypothetical protein